MSGHNGLYHWESGLPVCGADCAALEPVMNSTSESGRMEYEYHTPSLPLRCH